MLYLLKTKTMDNLPFSINFFKRPLDIKIHSKGEYNLFIESDFLGNGKIILFIESFP